MQLSRYINLAFVLAGLIVWLILAKLFGLLFITFEIADPYLLGQQLQLTNVIGIAVAAGAAFGSWRHPSVQTWANEVAVELTKVTWPTWDETKQNAMIVIVFSLVISVIVAGFDFFWKWLTDLLLVA